MNKFIRLLVILMLSVSSVFAQETNMRDVVILKNGEKIVGEILSKTDITLMIKTAEGKRFQFQTSEIVRIEKELISDKKNIYPLQNQGSFAGIGEMNMGGAKASNTDIPLMPMLAVSLAFGSKNAFGSKAFLGLGVGYETFLTKDKDYLLSFLPVFIHIHKNLTEKRTKPYLSGSAGYAFKMSDNYKGKAFLMLSGGLNFRIAQKSSFNIGIFSKIQKISGTIIESNNLGKFTYEGSTLLFGGGLSTSFIF